MIRMDCATDNIEWVDSPFRRIGRTRAPIIKIETALNKKLLLIEKADGSIYVTTDIKGKVVKVK